MTEIIKNWESFALKSGIFSELPETLRAHAAQFSGLRGVACFGKAEKDELCYCDRSPKSWRDDDESVILCTPEVEKELALKTPRARHLVVDDPRAGFIDLTRQLLASNTIEVTALIPRPFGISVTARIGTQSEIHPEARIDDDVVIGSNCTIHRGVWLQRGVKIGDGAVIGAKGINAYVSRDGRLLDFPHLAGAIIGAGVSIGANAVVMRGVLTSTVIGAENIIGNLCNIGHGVRLGERCWMSVGCLIGGHTSIGDGATLGMGSVIRDNLLIGENTQIGMGSVVVKNIAARASVFGNPARSVTAIKAGPSR